MKKLPLYLQILIGLAAGLIFGFIAYRAGAGRFVSDWIAPWGDIFIRLLKFTAVPLVFVSLLKGVANLRSIKKVSGLGLRTILIYLATTLAAVLVGITMVSLIRPGSAVAPEEVERISAVYGSQQGEIADIAEVLGEDGPLTFVVDMFPENFFAAAADNGSILKIIVAAILFGIAIILVGDERTRPVRELVESINDIIIKVIDMLMRTAPYGVFALMAGLVVSFAGSTGIFAALGLYVLTVALGLLFLTFVFYPLMIKLFAKIPMGKFLRGAGPVQLLAFSTSSSAATLPLTLEQTQRELGVSEQTASFVLPVGVTINMDGTSCYQAIAVLFIAQVIGLEMGFVQILTLIAVAVVSSIGTPGIPGGSIVMLMVVMGAVGIPAEWLALILGADRPLDMLRTVTNVTGDMTVACIVDTSANGSSNPALS